MNRLFILLLLVSLAACSCGNKENPEKAAVEKSAQEYYAELIGGNYEAYVDNMVGSDSIPANYREQKITMVKQFVAQQKEERGGMLSTSVVRSVLDKTNTSADVYLQICYGDSTNEEIVVPFVKDHGKWKLK